jgi:hypothetical protein
MRLVRLLHNLSITVNPRITALLGRDPVLHVGDKFDVQYSHDAPLPNMHDRDVHPRVPTRPQLQPIAPDPTGGLCPHVTPRASYEFWGAICQVHFDARISSSDHGLVEDVFDRSVAVLQVQMAYCPARIGIMCVSDG